LLTNICRKELASRGTIIESELMVEIRQVESEEEKRRELP
jgi:hypothetical protein